MWGGRYKGGWAGLEGMGAMLLDKPKVGVTERRLFIGMYNYGPGVYGMGEHTGMGCMGTLQMQGMYEWKCLGKWEDMVCRRTVMG